MIPGQFEYHRPSSISEAVQLLSSLGEEARVLAGGHSLIPLMKLRLALPEHLVDLQNVSDLNYIREDSGTLVIGAMTTQAELIASELLAEKCPILRETSLQIADPQVRNCGTIGGNAANGDPANDMPAVMQALDASYTAIGPNGERQISARTFYDSVYSTALNDDELLTAIRILTPVAGHGSAYIKQKRKVGDYATAAAAVILTMSGETCTFASIALSNVADTPLFAEAASNALIGKSLDKADVDAATAQAREIAQPVADVRGPIDFRTHVLGIMVARAIEAARARSTS